MVKKEELLALRLENARLQKRVEEQEKSLQTAQDLLQQKNLHILFQENQITNLTQALLQAKKKIFGASTEATTIDDKQLSFLTSDEEVAKELQKQQDENTVPSDDAKTTDNAKTKKKCTARKPGFREGQIKNLDTEIVEYVINPLETCGYCQQNYKQVGKRVVRTEATFIPAKIAITQYIQVIYKCTYCGQKDSPKPTDTFVKAPIPQPLFAHSLVSPSVLAHIVCQKYDMGLPLYRLEREFDAMGLYIPRGNMTRWVNRCANRWFEPLYKAFLRKVRQSQIIHCDETRIQCNREPGKKASSESFMWVMRTGLYEPQPVVFFHYASSRNGEVIRDLLTGFQGTIVADAYAAYGTVPHTIRSLCWAHLRRYFLESIPLDGQGKERPGSKGAEARKQCDKLFAIEAEIKEQTPEKILEQRQLRSQPLVDAFFEWVKQTAEIPTTNAKLTKALVYAANQEPELRTFLTDGRLPLSNNDGENIQRPFCAARRAWLFADTQDGARANGVLYSLIETAKLNGLRLYPYVKYLLENLPQLPPDSEPERIEKFLPWSEQLPDFCRNRILPEPTTTEKTGFLNQDGDFVDATL